MYFEHAGLNVPDPVAMSQWYVENEVHGNPPST